MTLRCHQTLKEGYLEAYAIPVKTSVETQALDVSVFEPGARSMWLLKIGSDQQSG